MAREPRFLLNNRDDEYPLWCTKPIPKKEPGKIRIWVDGCFDMMHFGHANALRQAFTFGDELFLGIHTDDEVIQYKGPPMMGHWERYESARACKWVTYVIENAPYVTRLKDLKLLEIDYVVHGDDISTDLNGNNSYQSIIDAGLFKVVKRTDGISTTDIVNRMLHTTKAPVVAEEKGLTSPQSKQLSGDLTNRNISYYLTTSRKIVQFSNNCVPKSTDRVVYVDGAFDLFHCGHASLLRAARALGDYLIVGVHDDSVMTEVKGPDYPIMNINERVLSVLSCKYVDECVMGVPYVITEALINNLGIHVVVHGNVYEGHALELDAYAVPKNLGIYQEIDAGSTLTTNMLIERIIAQREAFEARNAKKAVKDKRSAETKPEEFRNVKEIV